MRIVDWDLFHKDKIDSSNETKEGGKVVPLQTLVLKHEMSDDSKDHE